MSRTYDPNLDDVFVSRDGIIRWNGDEIGNVFKLDHPGPMGVKWRAEIGDPAKPEAWPPYRVTYDHTRKDAVAGVLDGVEAPT